MIPSTIARASENGRPRLPVRAGSKSSINAHCSSDNNRNRDTTSSIPATNDDLCQTRPRCIWPSGWWQSADGWVAAECAVAALSVVVLEPGCQGCCAFGVVGEGLAVGP